jgi:hypothetical protein
VRDHPRVFATLTAPSFGPVHNRPDYGRCRCGAQHADGDPALGTALDPERYDYAGAVLWNNYAGDLWRRFTIYLRREIAARAGVTQTALREVCRVSYGKVAEFQKRGSVHFHAVVRLDGPDGPDTAPPAWASVRLLDDAIKAAAARVSLPVPASGDHPARTLRWGRAEPQLLQHVPLEARPGLSRCDPRAVTGGAVQAVARARHARPEALLRIGPAGCGGEREGPS